MDEIVTDDDIKSAKADVYFGMLLSTTAQIYAGGTVERTVVVAGKLIEECAKVAGIDLKDLKP